MDKSKKIALFEQARTIAEEDGDWPGFIDSSGKLAMALIRNAAGDGNKNNDLAWTVIVSAYEKALGIDDLSSLLDVSKTLVLVGTMQIENLDSKASLEKLMINCSEFVLKNSKDIRSKWYVLNNIMSYEHTKSQNDARYLYWYDRLEEIEESICELLPGAETLLQLVSKKITAYRLRPSGSLLDEIEKLLSAIEKEYPELIDKPNVHGWQFYQARATMAEIREDKEAYIEAQLAALMHIKPFSPIDAANIVYNLAVAYYEKNCFDETMECLDASEEYIKIMWKSAWQRAAAAGLNAVRSDLFFYSWYFKLPYSFAAFLYVEKNNLIRSLAWQEKGLIRFYLTTIARTYDERFEDIQKVEDELNGMIDENKGTLFLHFSSHAAAKYCIATTAGFPAHIIKFPDDISSLLINLKNTTYENEDSFWEYYYVWQRTGAPGAFKRWKNVLDLLGELLAKYIFDLVLYPFEKAGIRKIVIAAYGWVDALPLQISRFGKGYLVESFILVQIPSLLAGALMPVSKGKGIAIMEGNHADLQWAAEEVVSLTHLAGTFDCPVQTIDDNINTVDRLTAAFQGLDAGVLHLATHMSYVRDLSSQTSIILNIAGNQEKLKVEDILSGNMLSVPSGVAVVLSGCESNMLNYKKQGDHVSLARSFLLSGAGSIVGSAWAVDDVASYFLMHRMYWCWFTDPARGFANALASAQQWLMHQNVSSLLPLVEDEALKEVLAAQYPERDTVPFSSPYYWAAWSYTGPFK